MLGYYEPYWDQPNELEHFGVKGMKWGVRRYQNADGTLTEAGKKKLQRYKAKAQKKVENEINYNKFQRDKARRDKETQWNRETYERSEKYSEKLIKAGEKELKGIKKCLFPICVKRK